MILHDSVGDKVQARLYAFSLFFLKAFMSTNTGNSSKQSLKNIYSEFINCSRLLKETHFSFWQSTRGNNNEGFWLKCSVL
ncbi:hypothetical protein Krac_10453 [Ktedonobacter racemifer DSM 44963]|uniref:Uncharacterized protein n=1 Tax=Ktedonobacter racemifer DSM 44963 TaxID=485913 RepID=D6TH08_KTERA|nr:hypothetical protein Krac_10453 [Ktedonobacter racemifer DSM 44963]